MILEQVKGNTWVLKGWAYIPLYKLDDRRCILLDTGSIQERADLEECLREAGLTVAGVLGSHAHIDHMGSHQYFRNRYGAKVAMSLQEAGRMVTPRGFHQQYPALDWSAIQAYPELAEVCGPIDQVILPWEDKVTFCGAEFEVLHTPGHSPGHICVTTPDGVLYAADGCMSPKARAKSKLVYTASVAGHLDSLDLLAQTHAEAYILAHKGIHGSLAEIIPAERSAVEAMLAEFFTLVGETTTGKDLMGKICRTYHITPENLRHMSYLEGVGQAYVNWFCHQGWMTVSEENRELIYRRA